MSDETKTPQAGEWWISYCDAIAYICGFDPDGDPVFLTDRKENAHVDTMSGFLENWHHEPLCTGWDWEPIDPATKALHELAITAGFDPLGLDPADIAEKMIAKQQVTGCSGESPDSVPENRPARDVIRDIVSWLDEKDGEIASPCMALETAQQWLDENPEEPAPFAKPFNDPRSGMGIRKDHVSWRPNSGQYDAATDVTYHAETPVESTDDWVDLPETHILRADIDQVLYEHDTINYWQEVCPSAGMRLNDSQYKRARCRRRDLPAPQPKRTPVRLFVSADVRWGDRYIVSVKDGNPNPERHQEVKFDGSGFYVEGGE